MDVLWRYKRQTDRRREREEREGERRETRDKKKREDSVSSRAKGRPRPGGEGRRRRKGVRGDRQTFGFASHLFCFCGLLFVFLFFKYAGVNICPFELGLTEAERSRSCKKE